MSTESKQEMELRYEEQPNVLSKEEARLLAVYPMSEGAFPIRCRLERWADLHSEGGEQDG